MKRCIQWLSGVWRALNASAWWWYRKYACRGVSPEHLGCFSELSFRKLLCSLTLFLLFTLVFLSFSEWDWLQAHSRHFHKWQCLFCYGCWRVFICCVSKSPSISFSLFFRSPTGSPMPGDVWRTRWGSQTWAGRSGSSCTTNMFRAMQRGSASAVTTAALKVQLSTTAAAAAALSLLTFKLKDICVVKV